MTMNEFKVWLDGYSYSFNVAPNAEQWGVIKQKLNTVKGDICNNPHLNQWGTRQIGWGSLEITC